MFTRGAAVRVGILCIGLAIGRVAPAGATGGAAAAVPGCAAELGTRQVATLTLPVAGRVPARPALPVPAGHELLVVASESGNDVTLELDPTASPGVAADSPVRRAGRQSLIVRPPGPLLRLRLTGKEHDAVRGTVAVSVYDLDGLVPEARCGLALRALAAADASYAAGQAVTLGRVHAGAGAARHAYRLAAEQYLRADGLLGPAGDLELRLAAAQALAALYYQDLQDWTRAAEWADRAATDAEALHRDDEAARARAMLAAAWIELATRSAQPARSTATPAPTHERFAAARALLARLERFYRDRGERYDAALQRNNIGLADLYEGRFATARAIFEGVAREFRALGERPREGVALQNVSLTEWGRGDLVAAAATMKLARERLTPEPYPKLYLIALTNSALLSVATGDFDAALRLNAEALARARATGMRSIESQSLYGLGVTYYALGDRDAAERYLVESLGMRDVAIDPRGRMASLRALGTLYGDAGRYDAAVAADEEALALSTTPPSRARMLVHLAADQAAMGRRDEAWRGFATVLDGAADADPGPRIEALIERGRALRNAGRAAEAIRDLQAALGLIRRHDSPDTEFRAQLELARALALTADSAAALAAVDRALARGEELRRQTANPEFRALRQEPLRQAYDLKVALLAERHRQLHERGDLGAAERVAREALAAAEGGRARSLADLAATRLTAPVGARLRPQLERREQLYRDLAARRYRLMEREGSAGASDLVVIALRREIAALRLELDALNAALARQDGTPPGRERLAAESLPARLPGDGATAAIVAYWLGAEQAFAWTITREGIHLIPLGPTAAITDAARAFHAALRDLAATPAVRRRELASSLYDSVIGPLARVLPRGGALIVVPDGALNFIPFAALRTAPAEDGHYLVEDHDVAVAPAVWWLTARPQPNVPRERPSRVLLVADPVYAADDERLVPARPPAASAGREAAGVDPLQFAGLRRLPWTARESAAVAALVPAAAVDQLSGTAATRARLLALDWSRYRVIHLASHGVVDAAMPQLSALVLSAFDESGARVEQALRVADLAPLEIRADLVALSACDTALGKTVAGEGSVSLASTAIARGAGAVLASLWQAPDEMAARLMTEFYQGVLIRRTGPVAALGAAMRGVLAAEHEADPALWAVFQLSVSRLEGGTVIRR